MKQTETVVGLHALYTGFFYTGSAVACEFFVTAPVATLPVHVF
jgi:hypothetical protein